jgi:hypothetical protein
MKKLHFDRSLLEKLRPRHAAIALFVVAITYLVYTRETALGYVFCLAFLAAGVAVERLMAAEQKQLDAAIALASLDAFQHACQLLGSGEAQGATAGLILIRDGLATRPAELHALVERFWRKVTFVDMADMHALVSAQTAKDLNLDDLAEFSEICDKLRESALNLLRAPRGGVLFPSQMFSKRWITFKLALSALNAKFVPPPQVSAPPASVQQQP